MNIAASDDSYCTTDDGEDNNNIDSKYIYINSVIIEPNEELEDIKEKVGETIKISEKLSKKILKVGSSNNKPTEIDNVVVKIWSYAKLKNTNQISKENTTNSDSHINHDNDLYHIKELSFLNQIELSIEENYLPKGVKKVLETMRKEEICQFEIPEEFITKYCIKNKINLTGQKVIFLNENNTDNENNSTECNTSSKEENILEKLLLNYSDIPNITCEKTSNITKLIKDLKNEHYHNCSFIFIIELINFFTIQNLDNEGLIKKKIIINGSKWYYPKEQDLITFSLKCYADEELLYTKEMIKVFLDEKSKQNEITLLEKRMIQNLKYGEHSEIYIQPEFFKINNSHDFIKTYPLANGRNVTFYAEMHNIEKFDYIYKDISRYGASNKKKIIKEGIGRDFPDRESYVKLKMLVKVNGKIIYNGFNSNNTLTELNMSNGNINNKAINSDNKINSNNFDKDFFYLKFCNDSDSQSYLKFRESKNQEFNITEETFDMEDDFTVSEKIYSGLNDEVFNITTNSTSKASLLDYDLKSYELPISVRKALVHMKRNEILYMQTNFIDYLEVDNIVLENISQSTDYFEKYQNFIPYSNEPKVEIIIHLFEFLHRRIFSNLPYQEKFDYLQKTKNAATEYFKQGKYYKSSKLFNNIYYRYSYGDVFGNTSKIKEDDLKNKNPQLYNELLNIKVASFLNLSNTKIKLNRADKALEVINKLLNENSSELEKDKLIKAYYYKGKALMMYNNEVEKLEQSILCFKKILEVDSLHSSVQEVGECINKCKELIESVNLKKKSLFKKMIFSNN